MNHREIHLGFWAFNSGIYEVPKVSWSWGWGTIFHEKDGPEKKNPIMHLKNNETV